MEPKHNEPKPLEDCTLCSGFGTYPEFRGVEHGIEYVPCPCLDREEEQPS